MSKLLNWYFEDMFNVESKIGLLRTILWAVILMGGLVFFFQPNMPVFEGARGDELDYVSMIGMSSLLIALDAMLLVVLNFRRLKTIPDALILATMVGTTHVVFPLFTFGLTALAYFLVEREIVHPLVSLTLIAAIYYVAFHFVSYHLKEVCGGLYEHDAEEAPDGLRSMAAVLAAWPAVFAVSIDALIVGPAKIAFMARYETADFLMSFVWIGLGVFALVLFSGLMVIVLRRLLDKSGGMPSFVKWYDFISMQLLVVVFMHFAIFAGVYVLYVFIPNPQLLATSTIWSATGVASAIFLFAVNHKKLWEAAGARSEAVQPEEAIAG
jgi:hypothetical protein